MYLATSMELRIMELSTAKKDVAVQLPYNCVRPPAPSPSTATGRRSPRRWGAGRSAANCAGTVQYSTVQYNEMSCTGRGRPASTGPTTPGGTAACSATPWPGTRATNEHSRSFTMPRDSQLVKHKQDRCFQQGEGPVRGLLRAL